MRLQGENGRWFTWEDGGGRVGLGSVVCNRTDADLQQFGTGWQEMTQIPNADGTFLLRIGSWYLTAEGAGGGALSTNRTDADLAQFGTAWQRFRIVPWAGRRVLLCPDGVHVVTVNGTMDVDCTGTLSTFAVVGESGGGGGNVPIVKRAPLAPFDAASTDPNTGAPLPVATVLTQTPPARGTLRWWRGNAWGVTVPDLPAVAGGADGAARSRVLTWFLDRYGREWEDRIFAAHLARGYDRFVLSPQDSMIGAGQSPADYVAMAKRVRAAGLLPCHMLYSKVYSGQNPNPALMDPLIDALLEADAIPLASVGWELNAFNSPEHLQVLIDHVAGRLQPGPQRLLYVHFLPGYAAWQPDRPGGSGRDFWLLQQGKLAGVLYQCDPTWSVGMMQARLNDVLVRLKAGGLWGLPADFDVVAWETIATLQFENHADEDRGDLVGFETLCTPGPMPVMGGGNGFRYPDGNAI